MDILYLLASFLLYASINRTIPHSAIGCIKIYNINQIAIHITTSIKYELCISPITQEKNSSFFWKI